MTNLTCMCQLYQHEYQLIRQQFTKLGQLAVSVSIVDVVLVYSPLSLKTYHSLVKEVNMLCERKNPKNEPTLLVD